VLSVSAPVIFAYFIFMIEPLMHANRNLRAVVVRVMHVVRFPVMIYHRQDGGKTIAGLC